MDKYLIEAGAGAGKTTTLVGGKKNDSDIKGIIECIKEGVKIEEIVAITFTEAATTELETRFKNKLLSLQSDDETIQKNIDEAKNNIDKINISTIHSFCNKILSEFTLDAHLPVVKNIIQGDEETDYFNSLFEKVISETELPMFISVYNFSVSDIKVSFIESFKKLRGELFSQKDINPFIDSECIKRNYEKLKNIYKKIDQYVDLTDEYFKKEGQQEIFPDNFSTKFMTIYNQKNKKIFTYNDIDFIENLLTKKEALCEIITFKKDKYAEEELIRLRNIYKKYKSEDNVLKTEIIEDIKEVVAEFKKIVITEWTKLLNKLLKKAYTIKENDNIFTNDDILNLTLDFLKEVDRTDNKNIKEQIAKQYKYIYIDEFQDTDPVQRDIFNLIYKFANECEDADLTLYYIGDPKQSIYRFRGADLDCYLDTKDEIEKRDVKNLPFNYRSSEAVLNYFNDVFKNTDNYFGEKIEYKEMLLGRSSEKEYYNENILSGVYKKIINSDDGKTDELRTKEAEYIADLIYNAVNNKVKINKRINNEIETKSIKYSDFMIITPKTITQKFYLNALKNKGISVNLQGKMNYTSVCYKLLNSIFMYFASQKNINFRKVYLSEVLIQDKEYKDITEEDLKPFSFIFNFIEEYKDKDVYLMLENINIVLSKINIDGNSEIYKIIDNLKTLKMNTYEDLYNNFTYLTQKKYERELKLFKDEDSVRIINLHKSKGLQSKIVILVDSISSIIEKKNVVMIHKTEDEEYHISPYKIGSYEPTIFALNDKLEEANDKEKIKLKEEYKRLVYVAATRAEEALIISTIDDEKKYWKPLLNIKNTQIKDISEIEKLITSCKDIKEGERESNKQEIVYKEFEYDKSLLNKTIEVLNPSREDNDKIKISEDEREEEHFSDITNGYTEDFKLLQPLFGTVVHRITEELVNEYCINKNYPNDIDLLIKGIIYEFVDIEMCEKVYQANLSLLKEKVDKFYKNEKLQNSIKNAKSIITELPFKYITEKDGKKVLVNGIMDLVIEKDNNNYEIWDYKTTKNIDNLESEQFEKELQNRYKNQMQIYKDTLKLILKEKDVNYKVEEVQICAL